MIENCPFNSMVECLLMERRCANCGWNPDVRDKRLKEYFSRPKDSEARSKEE